MRILSFVAAGFGVLFASTLSAAPPLSTKQILAQITNQPFIYRGVENGQKKEGRIVYERDGSMLILSTLGYIDGGTWRIISDQMCTKVTLGRAGRQVCFDIFPKIQDAYSTSHNYKLYPIIDERFKGV